MKFPYSALILSLVPLAGCTAPPSSSAPAPGGGGVWASSQGNAGSGQGDPGIGFGGQELNNCQVNVFPNGDRLLTIQAVVEPSVPTITLKIRSEKSVQVDLGGPTTTDAQKWADLDEWNKEYRVVINLSVSPPTVRVVKWDILNNAFEAELLAPTTYYVLGAFEHPPRTSEASYVMRQIQDAPGAKKQVRVTYTTNGVTFAFTLSDN